MEKPLISMFLFSWAFLPELPTLLKKALKMSKGEEDEKDQSD